MSIISDLEEVLEDFPIDVSLHPIVIKERKELLDKAVEGCAKSREILRTQYLLTMIYHNGKEIRLTSS